MEEHVSSLLSNGLVRAIYLYFTSNVSTILLLFQNCLKFLSEYTIYTYIYIHMHMYIYIYHVIFSFFLFFSSFLLLLKRRKECISTDAEKVFNKTSHAFITFKNTKKNLSSERPSASALRSRKPEGAWFPPFKRKKRQTDLKSIILSELGQTLRESGACRERREANLRPWGQMQPDTGEKAWAGTSDNW